MAGSLVDLSNANDGGEIANMGAGAIPDGGDESAPASTTANPHSEAVNAALNTVQSALNYGRQKYGLSKSNDAPAPANFTPYEGARQSTNIEDRRGDTSEPTEHRQTKFDDLVDKVSDGISEYRAKSNPLSQAGGFNDIAMAKGAIPDEQEEAP